MCCIETRGDNLFIEEQECHQSQGYGPKEGYRTLIVLNSVCGLVKYFPLCYITTLPCSIVLLYICYYMTVYNIILLYICCYMTVYNIILLYRILYYCIYVVI